MVLAEANPEYLGNLIRLHIATPVYEKFLSKKESHLPRGFHNEARQLFMEQARRYAAAAYAVLSYWVKRPQSTWPDYLKAEIYDAEKKLGKESTWPPGKESVDIIAVVRSIIDSRYGSKGDELGLDNVEHMDNEIFRKIYLDNNKLEAANDFMQKYKGFLSIDTLYDVIPISPWVYVKDMKE